MTSRIVETPRRSEHWVLDKDSAFYSLQGQGYTEVHRQMRSGRMWVLMGKDVEVSPVVAAPHVAEREAVNWWRFTLHDRATGLELFMIPCEPDGDHRAQFDRVRSQYGLWRAANEVRGIVWRIEDGRRVDRWDSETDL